MRGARFESRLLQPFAVRWLFVLLGVPLSYAVFRYHVVKGVEWSHFPLYIANKGVALSAVFFIGVSYLLGKMPRVWVDKPQEKLIFIKFCGLGGFSLAAVHALASMLLLTPNYFPKFFLPEGRLNLVGELSLAFGVLSLWSLSVAAITSLRFMYDALGEQSWRRAQRIGYFSLTLVAGHVATMGLSSWLGPEGWAGSLPPISLIAFVAAVIPILVKLARI